MIRGVHRQAQINFHRGQEEMNKGHGTVDNRNIERYR